jgi:hypothetical protein
MKCSITAALGSEDINATFSVCTVVMQHILVKLQCPL